MQISNYHGASFILETHHEPVLHYAVGNCDGTFAETTELKIALKLLRHFNLLLICHICAKPFPRIAQKQLTGITEIELQKAWLN